MSWQAELSMQKEQAAALLTGPSEASSSNSHAVPDMEKQQLLERIQQLEAAGQGSPGRWQGHNSFAEDEEHLRCVLHQQNMTSTTDFPMSQSMPWRWHSCQFCRIASLQVQLTVKDVLRHLLTFLVNTARIPSFVETAFGGRLGCKRGYEN